MMAKSSIPIDMQFSPNMIPEGVDTFEKLTAWAGSNLVFNGFTLNYQERQPSVAAGDQGIQPEFERTGPFRAWDDTPRIIFRFALRLKPDHASSLYAADWEAVEEAVTSAPNVNFLNATYQA